MKIAGSISKQISVSASVCACFWVPECVSGGETVVMLDQADCVGWHAERAPQPENTFSLRRLPCSQPAVLLYSKDLSFLLFLFCSVSLALYCVLVYIHLCFIHRNETNFRDSVITELWPHSTPQTHFVLQLWQYVSNRSKQVHYTIVTVVLRC